MKKKNDLKFDELDSLATKGVLFTHKEKGHAYRIERRLISKHPDTGLWYDAVLYVRMGDGVPFVRSTQSFIENFEVIEYNIKEKRK